MSSLQSPAQSPLLRIAQIGWVILAILYFGVFIAAIPAGYDAFQTTCEGEACQELQLTQQELIALEEIGISRTLYAGILAGADLLMLSWAGLGVFIALRRSDDWMGLLVSMTLIAIGINALSSNSNALARQMTTLNPLFNALSAIGAALLILMVFTFPDGRLIPRWTRFVAIPLIVVSLADPFFVNIVPPMEAAPGTVVGLAAILAGIMLGLLAQIQRYRKHSDLVQRQQTKWVIFGFVALMLEASIWTATVVVFPAQSGFGGTYYTLVSLPIQLLIIVALPITITISILRYRLFDIDIIIKRTVVYGALTISIVFIYLAAVVALQSVLRALTGQGDQLAIVASTLLIAALFNPLRGRIQTIVNRRFFRGDYDAAQALTSFGESMQEEVDLERMQSALLTTVEETMQPSKLSLWLKED